MTRSQRADILSWLSGYVLQRYEQGNRLLPPITAMAREAGCAPATMQRAVQELTRVGVLEPRSRRGTRILSKPAAGRSEDTPMAVHHHRNEPVDILTDSLVQRIVSGEFRPGGRLPGYKELSRRVGGGYRSLIAACRRLCADGLLQPQGRGWKVSEIRRPRSQSRIVLCAQADTAHALAFQTPRSSEFLRELEQTCLATGVDVEFQPLPHLTETRISSWRRDRRPLLGLIVWMVGMGRRERDVLLAAAQHHNLRIAFFDEHARISLPRQALGSGTVCRVGIERDFDAGRAVGRELLGLGHREVCCFDLWPERSPSPRLRGIADAFAQAGIGERAHLVCGEQPLLTKPARSRSLSLERAKLHRRHSWLARFHPARLNVHARLRHDMTYRDRVAQSMASLFDIALTRYPDATAWVCGTDMMAAYAQAFLNERTRPSRDRVSIVGFDDTLDAFGAQLASYSFNVAAAARACVDHILGPTYAHAAARAGELTVPGRLLLRRSLHAVSPNGPSTF